MFIYIAQRFIIISVRFTQAKLNSLKNRWVLGPFLNDLKLCGRRTFNLRKRVKKGHILMVDEVILLLGVAVSEWTSDI